MPFIHGKEARFLMNEFNLSSFLNNMDITRDVDVPESTTYGTYDRTYIAGLRNATVSTSGFFDGATDASDPVLAATLGVTAARIVSAAPEGFAVGNIVYMFQTHTSGYNITEPVDGITSISADLQHTSQVDRGVSLHTIAAETATADGTSVDNGASTANGGVGYLHVLAASGTNPTLDVVIEDSADDAIWAALITFAQATDVTSERATASGTVDQFVRAQWTITGSSPSFTFVVAFARR